MKFNDKEYEYYSWSIIEFPIEHLKYYRDISQQVIENSEYFTPKFGYDYESIYKELEPFLEKQSKFIPVHHKDYIFLISRFIKGTFILKLVNE